MDRYKRFDSQTFFIRLKGKYCFKDQANLSLTAIGDSSNLHCRFQGSWSSAQWNHCGQLAKGNLLESQLWLSAHWLTLWNWLLSLSLKYTNHVFNQAFNLVHYGHCLGYFISYSGPITNCIAFMPFMYTQKQRNEFKLSLPLSSARVSTFAWSGLVWWSYGIAITI